jgi:hypothetical protein
MRALTGQELKLHELAVAIGGTYPADLEPALQELERCGKITRVGDYYRNQVSAQTESGPLPPVSSLSLLPPHPTNMDWRYERATAELLAVRSLEASTGAGLLIGAPSALTEWCRLAPSRPATLLDASEIMVRSINSQLGAAAQQARHFDMCRPLDWQELRSYDVCLCDPPWYREHYLGALGIASAALVLGARMLVSLLPPSARPAADLDRNWIIQQAEQLGFHLVSLEPNLLRYETPVFEHNSLATAGISVPAAWRRGDLATFVKVRDIEHDVRSAVLTPLASLELAEREFAEVEVGGRIVRIRGPFDDLGMAPELIRIEACDILQSVSRRYAGRAKIGLWLPDNRVFGVRGRAAFWHALAQMSEKPQNLPTLSEDGTIAIAFQLLESLLANNDSPRPLENKTI